VYYIRPDASRKTRENARKPKMSKLCTGGRIDRFTGRGIMKVDTVHVKRV
jgi:hypothetical protein